MLRFRSGAGILHSGQQRHRGSAAQADPTVFGIPMARNTRAVPQTLPQATEHRLWMAQRQQFPLYDDARFQENLSKEPLVH